MEISFKNQVAFITGASSGIGRATAIAFAESGANVMLADVIPQSGEEVAAIAKRFGGKAIFQRCDVSNEDDVRRAVERTVAEFGRLDVAFNNAGIEGLQGSTVDCSNDNWDQVINTNLKGVWLCMKHEIKQMLSQGSGSIVNCSSIAGLVGFQGIPAYVASKHGVVGLTQTAALELAHSNIRVNAVCPGVIQTPMIERFTKDNPESLKNLANGEPVGRLGRPEEIADAVLWLSSSKASFVTGQSIAVDGGWTAQ